MNTEVFDQCDVTLLILVATAPTILVIEIIIIPMF